MTRRRGFAGKSESRNPKSETRILKIQNSEFLQKVTKETKSRSFLPWPFVPFVAFCKIWIEFFTAKQRE